MSNLYKQLAGQTAIYGLSSIIGRLLNYLLVPYYTRLFLPEEYGVVAELYSYVAFLLILLTYGLETGYFRYVEKSEQPRTVYSSLLISLFISSTLFIILIYHTHRVVASWIDYEYASNYILILGIVVALDAFSALPFAKLRYENKALRFAALKIFNIFSNIGFNLFFFEIVANNQTLSEFFNFRLDVYYVFLSNLIATVLTLLLLAKDIILKTYKFDFGLYKKILVYSLPLLLVGLTGMINEAADKILLKQLIVVPDWIDDNKTYIMRQIGIYGANFKLAIFMVLFIQAFRFAVEPFFFSNAASKDSKQLYANVMHYFLLFGLIIFLGINFYLDIVKYFIDPAYHEGLHIVPILLAAKLMFGLLFTLSIWYKIVDKTYFGILISVTGALITLGGNIIFIPYFGYLASAWSAFATYFGMLLVSYLLMRRINPIPYRLKSGAFYVLVTLFLFFISQQIKHLETIQQLIINTLLLILFLGIVVLKENIHKSILLLVKNRNHDRR